MKRALLLFLVAIMLAALPAASYAANETEMNTVLTYTVGEPAAPSEPEPSGTYTIIIPSTINLNDRTDFAIQAENVSLADSKKVVVVVEARTFTGDDFYLYNDGTDARIQCYLYHSQNPWGTEPYAQISAAGDSTVAEFKNGDTVSRIFGRVFVIPMIFGNDLAPGAYSGTIYFKISVKDG